MILRKFGVPENLVNIINSFHNNMHARIRVDGELLEEIDVENGLHQGCTLAPTLFNLYACAMAERWVDRVNNIDGVGTYVSYKLDKQLFRQSVRGACEMVFFKGEFVDDVAQLATTREAAELAINTYTTMTFAVHLLPE